MSLCVVASGPPDPTETRMLADQKNNTKKKNDGRKPTIHPLLREGEGQPGCAGALGRRGLQLWLLWQRFMIESADAKAELCLGLSEQQGLICGEDTFLASSNSTLSALPTPCQRTPIQRARAAHGKHRTGDPDTHTQTRSHGEIARKEGGCGCARESVPWRGETRGRVGCFTDLHRARRERSLAERSPRRSRPAN